jgi:hypothetical protein
VTEKWACTLHVVSFSHNLKWDGCSQRHISRGWGGGGAVKSAQGKTQEGVVINEQMREYSMRRFENLDIHFQTDSEWLSNEIRGLNPMLH